MAETRSSLELSMAAEPISVRLLRSEVLDWLRAQRVGGDSLAAAVALATSEAVANVVRHAYGREGGRVELRAERCEDHLLVRVTDRGLGLTASTGSRTGLGLPVIGRVSNGVTVASDAQGTTVSMRFAWNEHRSRARRVGSSARSAPVLGIG